MENTTQKLTWKAVRSGLMNRVGVDQLDQPAQVWIEGSIAGFVNITGFGKDADGNFMLRATTADRLLLTEMCNAWTPDSDGDIDADELRRDADKIDAGEVRMAPLPVIDAEPGTVCNGCPNCEKSDDRHCNCCPLRNGRAVGVSL